MSYDNSAVGDIFVPDCVFDNDGKLVSENVKDPSWDDEPVSEKEVLRLAVRSLVGDLRDTLIVDEMLWDFENVWDADSNEWLFSRDNVRLVESVMLRAVNVCSLDCVSDIENDGDGDGVIEPLPEIEGESSSLMVTDADFDGDRVMDGIDGLRLLREGVIRFVDEGDFDCIVGVLDGTVLEMVNEASLLDEPDLVPVTCMLIDPCDAEGVMDSEWERPSFETDFEGDWLPVRDGEKDFDRALVSEMDGLPVADSVGVFAGADGDRERDASKDRDTDKLTSCVCDAVGVCVLD